MPDFILDICDLLADCFVIFKWNRADFRTSCLLKLGVFGGGTLTALGAHWENAALLVLGAAGSIFFLIKTCAHDRDCIEWDRA